VRKYKATYKDKRGTGDIIVKSDGRLLYTTIRGIELYGGDFDQLAAEVIDKDKFDYEMFADGSGDITNFLLTITYPIQFYNALSNQISTGSLVANIVVGEDTTIKGLDHELTGLTLKISSDTYTVNKKLEWMEDALILLQKQLPVNIYLKTCLSCKYSNYSPYGGGMFGSLYCFKNIKEQLTSLNDKTDLFNIWTKEAMDKGDILDVQETFDCEEHQLLTDDDWVYKSWVKTIKINENVAVVENTLFYKEINELLREHFAVIKEDITSQYELILKERQFNHPLPILDRYEYSSWGGNRQWRLDLDFDNYEWSYKFIKPHFICAVVSFETTKGYIHFKHQLCSSFNEALLPMKPEKIEVEKLNSVYFVAQKKKEIQQFINELPKRFLQEIKVIDFEELEFLENEEA